MNNRSLLLKSSLLLQLQLQQQLRLITTTTSTSTRGRFQTSNNNNHHNTCINNYYNNNNNNKDNTYYKQTNYSYFKRNYCSIEKKEMDTTTTTTTKDNDIELTDQTTTSTTSTTSTDTLSTEEKKNIISITEGSATIVYNSQNEVFYNPVQEFNRDLSILMIQLFIEQRNKELKEKGKPERKFKLLEALSATGLRSIRYAKEIEGLESILTNDIEPAAVESIKKNRDYNNVDPNLLIPNLGDATMVMYQHRDPRKQFDIVDLDPYGAPSIFIDGAVQSVADGGLLCVTATDAAILCGNYPETCYAKYGSVPLKGDACHEMAVRILLHTIETHANRYKRHIVPVLSMSIDFYVRVFVRVYSSPLECKKSFSRLSNIYSCVGCGSFRTVPLGQLEIVGNGGVEKRDGSNIKYKTPMLNRHMSSTTCEFCKKGLHVAGPFWSAPIHNVDVCKSALAFVEKHPAKFNTAKKIFGMVTAAAEELPDALFYFKNDHFSAVLHTTSLPGNVIRSAILNGGYRVSSSHVQPCIKTDAPQDFLWDIYKTHAKNNPPKNIAAQSPAQAILQTDIKHTIDFTLHPKASGETPNVPKYLPNPKDNWGPGSRATGGRGNASPSESMIDKRAKNQGKNRSKKESPASLLCKRIRDDGSCPSGKFCKFSHDQQGIDNGTGDQNLGIQDDHENQQDNNNKQ
ncbi:putative N(2),N(2)-dimethylguanosine tRNA methyltransferase [Cavenderia fasciculata]|uniref:tRNA (guanine(26)-N(2))-dimethyltransferase n=1 Tax=Cavenderia fasciculata TaxID=261658 RepID=F4Q103_CACFS|nr:putative N(2),N(2)-dimethylguanosine tRNA methyltransferase [Cavenderia fasciculata]EGG18504.1 putative N(2),N(2)-dimethylguanosine tRNA methyltransferase [Cavenderia fasciculata]|eukprot:XP_004366408.1 putative N(2),N(2)-dimethylguanosine tRNA methyltransferase [Cavenderia fasciculata]